MEAREGQREGGRKAGKCGRETTGVSGTWETRIAQPQIGSAPERMYKHMAGFLGKSGCPMNGLFVCQPLKRCGEQHTRETFTETVKTQSLLRMKKELLIPAKAKKLPLGL